MSLYTKEEIDKYFQGKTNGGTPLFRAKKFELWRKEWKDRSIVCNTRNLNEMKQFIKKNEIPRCDWLLQYIAGGGGLYYFRHEEDYLAAVLTII